ncbi:cytochrome P450 4c3 [Caerostris extrusa]|uniref:Cytochrome P450 4c3 n=1 Tax=Caerostris extrusa TaxID=172846 RepID=A0AAV4R0S2_CAEEX|nr:cytochrome P450 4c3 [Caerostris extrusa]
MLLEIFACVSISVIVLLAKLSWWRKRCNRFIPNGQPSFFNPLGGIFDYDGFEISGKKYAVHLSIISAFRKWSNTFRKFPLFCEWLTYVPFVLIHKSEAVKDLLQVKKNIEKELGLLLPSPILRKRSFTWLPHRLQRTLAQVRPEYLMKETDNEFTIVDELISLSTLDIVCECIMGVNIGAFENKSKQYVESLHRTIIEERKQRYLNGETAEDSSRYKSLLEVLLKLHIEDQVLDEEGVRQEVDTFIIAGHDTVATTIKWTLYLIGLHPEVQEKIHQELDSVLEGDAQRPLSVDDLSDLKYLDCVLKNKLFRMKINNYSKIMRWLYAPKGASAIVMTYFLHRDEEVFPDPEKFNPDRFLPEYKNKIPECAYVPFGAGPRNCIGKDCN